MKALKLSLVIMAAALVTIGLRGMAFAYHDGGVAECEGCHTMHNSLAGVAMFGAGFGKTNVNPVTKSVGQGVNYLLKGSDQSSVCLNCHAGLTAPVTSNTIQIMSYPIPSGAPYGRSPGGDFAWLGKNYSTTSTGTYSGTKHGHNIIAADFGLVEDPILTMAPGGNYASANMYCTSCHNPHSNVRIYSNAPVTFQYPATAIPASAVSLPISQSGSYPPTSTTGWPPLPGTAEGVYRLLGGQNYLPMSYKGGPAFKYDPPVAIAPITWNQSEASAEVKVAYGYGMSEWCANCHSGIYNNISPVTSGHFIHPNGYNALLNVPANVSGTSTTIAAIYNAYRGSGNLTGGQTTSYTSLVPYEQGGTIGTDLTASGIGGIASSTAPMYSTPGPITTYENVMCLSCHRAHASGFPQIGRWPFTTEFITSSGNYPAPTSSNSMSATEFQAAMYDRPASDFATFQRSLCNKCHGKD